VLRAKANTVQPKEKGEREQPNMKEKACEPARHRHAQSRSSTKNNQKGEKEDTRKGGKAKASSILITPRERVNG